MNEEEKKDLDEVKAKITQEKLDTFDWMFEIARFGRADLDNSGYRNKTNAEAVLQAFQSACTRIKKLNDDFFKKWPD
jgi:hypothetical protein